MVKECPTCGDDLGLGVHGQDSGNICHRCTITALRAQLQQAQEERDRLATDKQRQQEYIGELIDSRFEAWKQNRRFRTEWPKLEAERDSAIERGVCAINYLEAYYELLGQVRQQLIEEHERAEIAEADAKAKGALAEERRRLLQGAINTRGCPYCGWADGRHPQKDCPYLAALTDAEAQGGQEED